MQPSTLLPRVLQSPQKPNTRILLVETNNSDSSQRYQRYTLQEVINASPTYYDSASLSPRSSIASTVSTRSDLSSLSQSASFSPPASPVTQENSTPPPTAHGPEPVQTSRPSWIASMEDLLGNATHMIGSTLPLGWLRPSLTSSALLDMNYTGYSSHFVFLGFGQSDTLVDDDQQVMCTLATIPSDGGDESPYLENLTLNRIGVTSILLALPVDSTVNEIMAQLGQINKSMTGIDPHGTWWERLILVFHHHGDSSPDLFELRSQLVQTTLPSLMPHISVLPCVTLLGSPPCQARRILYQQACMHQTDHGWWHGSTAPVEDTSSSSDDDDGVLLPVAIMVGNKAVTPKKKLLFTVDAPPTPPTNSSYPFLSNPASPSLPVTNTVELKHRFSKKWTEAPRRHHTKRSYRSPIPHN